jgi:hypothetical protein
VGVFLESEVEAIGTVGEDTEAGVVINAPAQSATGVAAASIFVLPAVADIVLFIHV